MLLNLGFFLLHAALLAPVHSDQNMQKCPDGTMCHKSNTCCKLLSGRYSCCRITNAVCCTTRNSCCPEHYVCHPTSSHCTKGPIVLKTTFTTETMGLNTTPAKTSTELKTTAAVLQFTTSTAAPTTTSSATQTAIATEPLQEVPAPVKEAMMQKCPSDDTYCFQNNNTCCRVSSSPAAPHQDTFGCCPDKDAVCCADMVNCCPRGFNCIGDTGNCAQTAPVGRSGEIFPSWPQQDAPFKPRHVSAMRIESGRQRPPRPVVKN